MQENAVGTQGSTPMGTHKKELVGHTSQPPRQGHGNCHQPRSSLVEAPFGALTLGHVWAALHIQLSSLLWAENTLG